MVPTSTSAVERRLRHHGLQILVADRDEAPRGITRFLAAPEEFERLLDVVAPGGEEDFGALDWTVRVEAIDIEFGAPRANWVLAIAIDVPDDSLGELERRLGDDASETGDGSGSVMVEGSTTVH
jgi:hypothetical protein